MPKSLLMACRRRNSFLDLLRAGFSVLSLLLLTSGCTKGIPQFGELDSENIPQPLFNNKRAETKTVMAVKAGDSIHVSGTCSPLVDTLSFRIVGLFNWGDYAIDLLDSSLSANDTDGTAVVVPTTAIDCKGAGTFSFYMKDFATLFPTQTAASYTFVLEARSETVVGPSNPSTLTINYSIDKPVNSGNFRITQGSGYSQGANHKLRGSVIWRSGAITTGTPTAISINHQSR
jgi:hypothetical protein